MTTTKMHQILAVEPGVKQASNKAINGAYHLLQKPVLLEGIARTYRPLNDEDPEVFPAQTQRVQVKVTDLLFETQDSFRRLWDVEATKDWGNTVAKADIEVDGHVVLDGVPATFLLYMETQLTDLSTFIEKLPTLDPAETWTYSGDAGAYATEPVETHKTKKVNRVLVKAEATKEHPAQTEVYGEDVITGYWKTTKYSGALPADHQRQLLDRVRMLRQAVRAARARANEAEVDQQKVAGALLDYVFSGAAVASTT